MRPLAAAALLALCACSREPRPPARPEPPSEPPPRPEPGHCREDWIDATCHLVGVRNEPADGGRFTVRAGYQYENGPDRTEVAVDVAAGELIALREQLAAHPDVPCRVRYLTAPCPPHVLEWSVPVPGTDGGAIAPR